MKKRKIQVVLNIAVMMLSLLVLSACSGKTKAADPTVSKQTAESSAVSDQAPEAEAEETETETVRTEVTGTASEGFIIKTKPDDGDLIKGESFYALIPRSRYGGNCTEDDYAAGKFLLWVERVELSESGEIVQKATYAVPYIVSDNGDRENLSMLSGGPDGEDPYGSSVWKLTTDKKGEISNAEAVNGSKNIADSVKADYTLANDTENGSDLKQRSDGYESDTIRLKVTQNGNEILGEGTYRYRFHPTGTRDGKTDHWKIDVFYKDGENINYQIDCRIDTDSSYIPEAEDVILERDVNADGLMDITALKGVSGAQAVRYEKAYIRSGDTFEEASGYDEIPEPVPCSLDSRIYGTIRDGAAAYIQVCYEMEGNRAVKRSEQRYEYDEDAQDYVAVN